MHLCDLCQGTGRGARAPLSDTNGGGREVLGKVAPVNYNLATLQNFTRGTVCEWLTTHTTFFILLKLLILSAFSFVQDSAWSWSV